MENDFFKLPPLPYSTGSLEPVLDSMTVTIHYTKHHAAYTRNLNEIARQNETFFRNKTIEEILSQIDSIPKDIRQDVINQGGGYANHNLYWTSLSPNGGDKPYGVLANAINQTFGSFETLKKTLTSHALNVFGSGWTWLVLNEHMQLEVMNTSNQDSPLSVGKIPLLTIDVWEHAYYLGYQHRRRDYVSRIFEIINWDEVENKYEQAKRQLHLG